MMKTILNILLLIIFTSITLSFSGKGSGTIDDPYQITNISQLQEIKDEYLAHYKLMNNIDASETRYWNFGNHDGDTNTQDEPMGFEPINLWGAMNLGSLNGDGHIINNLYINRPLKKGVALFNYTYGNIRKVGIENCNITGSNNVSSLCANFAVGIIEECYTTGIIIVKGKNDFNGGFCGYLTSGSIYDSYTSCQVLADSIDSDYRANSFCENFSAVSGPERCYTIGNVISYKKVSAFGQFINAFFCFWDVETTGIPDTGGHEAKGLPTSEMKKKATYVNAGWDFDSVWCIDEGKDYPKLRVFGKCKPVDVPEEPNRIVGILKISPNPTTTTCTISFSQEGLCRKFQVFNCFGADVTRILMNTKINDNNIQIDVSALSGGVYFAMLDLNGRHYSKPFVVLR